MYSVENDDIEARPPGRRRHTRRWSWGQAVKRLVDVFVAALALVLLAPAAAVVALAVARSMGRPVIFRQSRPGREGVLFDLLKFRTMKPVGVGVGEEDYQQRLTGVGRFLRRTSLDEIPQLVNILKGDLSLVGPRPLLVEYLPLYTPEQARRHEVRPGLTGLAQIRGRSCLEMAQRLAYDVWYVDNWSLWLDLRILIRTVGCVLAGTGVGRDATPQPAWSGSHAAAAVVREPLSVGWSGGPGRALRVRSMIWPMYDAGAWGCALYLAAWCRYDWDIGLIQEHRLLGGVVMAVIAQWLLGTAVRAYCGRYYLGSAEQAWNLAVTAFGVGGALFFAQLLSTTFFVPRSVPLIAPFIMFVLAAGGRLVARGVLERRSAPAHTLAQRTLVFGAGEAGRELVKALRAAPDGKYLPVAVLDDDPALRHRSVCGLRVRGGRADLATVATDTGATLVVIAMPSVNPSVVRDLARAALAAGLAVKQVPPISELLNAPSGLTDLREVDAVTLLGRSQVRTDLDAVAGYISGKRVLVTGAGGSIGSELCRQIDGFGPAELMMLDRDESALHAVQLLLEGTAMLNSRNVILADIRERQVIHDLFVERAPEVVFHAAALKHLPVLEQYPLEAWKTNVLGTANVVDAARAIGVERFVNISTDKAANPSSNLGRSKRIAERLVAAAATDAAARRYLSVRFGNVLGSRGSVLTTFVDQITAGRPVTVTHPDVTRFFMTITEAVQLVIQAGAIGDQGEVLVLDMGTPVRIVDMATSLMEIAGKWTSIVYTGLREGEKLHEELFGAGEHAACSTHPSISHAPVPPLPIDKLQGLFEVHDPVQALHELSASVRHQAPSVPPVTIDAGAPLRPQRAVLLRWT